MTSDLACPLNPSAESLTLSDAWIRTGVATPAAPAWALPLRATPCRRTPARSSYETSIPGWRLKYTCPTILHRQIEHSPPRARQDAVHAPARVAVGVHLHRHRQVRAAGADDELPDAMDGIGAAIRVLRREALEEMLVAAEYHLDTAVVQRAPHRLHRARVAVRTVVTPRKQGRTAVCAEPRREWLLPEERTRLLR